MNVGAALLGGIAGFAAWVAVAYACHTIRPRLFTFNPLYFAGATFTIETSPAYTVGFAALLATSAAYSVVIGALAYAFDAGGLTWLVGLIAGMALAIVSGATLGYANLLHRGVRTGALGAPGPFALAHGATGVAAVFAWHAVFGVVSGIIYGALA